MATQKIFAFRKTKCIKCAENRPTIHAGRNLRTSNACYAKANTQPITKIIWFTRNCKKVFSLYYGEKCYPNHNHELNLQVYKLD